MKRRWPFLLLIPFLVAALCFRYHPIQKNKGVAIEESTSTCSSLPAIADLQMLLNGFAIQSMVDIPSYLKSSPLPLKQYIGMTELISDAENLQKQFGSFVHSFLASKLTIDTPPKVDLILCWDELFKLSSSEIRSALYQIKKSGSKYLLMRQCSGVTQNHKNKTGALQPINWKLAPYNFPEPLLILSDDSNVPLALWEIDKI